MGATSYIITAVWMTTSQQSRTHIKKKKVKLQWFTVPGGIGKRHTPESLYHTLHIVTGLYY